MLDRHRILNWLAFLRNAAEFVGSSKSSLVQIRTRWGAAGPLRAYVLFSAFRPERATMQSADTPAVAPPAPVAVSRDAGARRGKRGSRRRPDALR